MERSSVSPTSYPTPPGTPPSLLTTEDQPLPESASALPCCWLLCCLPLSPAALLCWLLPVLRAFCSAVMLPATTVAGPFLLLLLPAVLLLLLPLLLLAAVPLSLKALPTWLDFDFLLPTSYEHCGRRPASIPLVNHAPHSIVPCGPRHLEVRCRASR